MPTFPTISTRPFGVLKDGRETTLFTLKNDNNVSISISNYGATIVSYLCPDRLGNIDDIVLGFDHVSEYEKSGAYMGATIGRFANRIAEAQFNLNGKSYQLDANAKPHHLHGGFSGFSERIWHADILDKEEPSIRFSLFSPDGDQGYPGNLTIHVLYKLNHANQLRVQIDARCDSDTPVSITNHSYFNLAGSGNIEDHWLTIHSDQYTPLKSNQIPTGEFVNVEDSPFDFTDSRQIGECIEENHPQLKIGSGYDHNFMTPAFTKGGLQPAAKLEEKTSGRILRLATDAPGIQLYTANFLDPVTGKNIQHQARHAVCLEPQNIPDSPNQAIFPSSILKAGERYQHTILYETDVN